MVVELDLVKFKGAIDTDVDSAWNRLVVGCGWTACHNDDILPTMLVLERWKCALVEFCGLHRVLGQSVDSPFEIAEKQIVQPAVEIGFEEFVENVEYENFHNLRNNYSIF